MADEAYFCSPGADRADETQGRGLHAQDHSVLDQCLDFAIEVSKGRFFQLSSQFPSNEFSLDTTAFAELTYILQNDPRVSIDKAAVEKRCTDCLQRTNGFVRAAIAIKIPYEKSYTADASPLRHRLDECLVSLWVWREGQVQRDIHWKSVTTTDANLTLKKSYFADDVPASPFPTQRSTRNRNRLPTPAEAAEPVEPAVRIPFTELEGIIRQAIDAQISRQKKA
ncbi:hypothetical protein K4K54_001271 [Colletotrichum sp. SAR 10_86]|nr:hypothetical protein K4K50_001640 [Colletotrichum sp. SAR 10_71]KAI8180376.1 hypothetical protein K4K51_002752 [Colletotrichum sp. SAR 10_75]KAI8229707.1 hypothetical protein K4K54_001271 [Colletotrichum sp. SAR 10_86]KAI8249063.1 hypothetical protein K4K53_000334 [Colletotrichum sp. SAR 10_77]